MTTLEEQYKLDVKTACGLHPKGSDERAEAKTALWDKFQADSGSVDVIHRHQKIFVREILKVIVAYYGGGIPLKDYGLQRSEVFLQYARKMVELGLATEVPSAEWIAAFTAAGLQAEEGLFKNQADVTTCKIGSVQDITLRGKATEVFLAFHTQFGKGVLKDKPETYGGIIASLKEEELASIRRIF
jgi:hypothetical protein